MQLALGISTLVVSFLTLVVLGMFCLEVIREERDRKNKGGKE